jgi:hypothetical protein
MSNFKNMKFNCKDLSQEERANLQMKLFSLGYSWISGSFIKHTDKPYIYTYPDGYLYYVDDDDVFEKKSFIEYKFFDGELVKVDDSVTQHTDDFGNTHTKKFPLAHRPSDDGSTMIAYRPQYKQEQEDKMEYIKLTYAEAWQALKDGKEVLYNGMVCRIGEKDLIQFINNNDIPFPVRFTSTEKLCIMKKEPEFESLGLSDDCVEIEVFGLKLYQDKMECVGYSVEKCGFIRDSLGYWHGKIKYKGDHDKAKIKVTVDKDGNITYEDVA